MQPLFFAPILKRICWGGTRLGSRLGKPLGLETDYAESWEIVDHGHDQSVSSQGEFQGWSLKRFVEERNKDLFGRHAGLGQFPLLVKFLDANDRLSLQVHPNDEQAITYDPKENGKTEAWVIVHAEPGSVLYAGLKAGVDRKRLSEALANSRLEECLHRFEVFAGDCVFIPAGTLHAIAEGIVLAEIQQSSDLTFRLHDWGRVGTDGQPRPLHLEQSFACIDFERGPVSPVVPQPLALDHSAEELVRSDYFVIHRHQCTSEISLSIEDRFHVVMMLAGSGVLSSDENEWPMNLGQSVLIPAACADLNITPQPGETCIVLDAFLP